MPTITHTPRLLDTDTSPSALAPDRALLLTNLVPELGYTGLAAGTVAIPLILDLPAGLCFTLGAVADPEGQSIVRFIWNENGEHRLLRIFPALGQEVELLRPPLLDLQESDFISQAGIIGDYLGWLDRDGRQYRINMKAAANGTYASIADKELIALALPVPLYPPAVSRVILSSNNPTNRIAGNDWQVAYVYGYSDNDETILSPPSAVDKATKLGNDQDGLVVKLAPEEVPGPLVQRISFYVRKNANPVWQRINTLRRDPITNQFPVEPRLGYLAPGFVWQGLTFGDNLDDTQAGKLNEAIPLTSQALGAADNRFFLGDNEEGYAPTQVGLTAAVESTGRTFAVEQKPLYELKFERLNEDGKLSIEFYTDFILVAGTDGQSTARYVNAAYNEFLRAYFEVEGAKQFTRDQLAPEAGRLAEQQGGSNIVTRETDFAPKGSVPYVRRGLVPTVKGNTTCQLGLEFTDYAGRTSGTLTSESAVVYVPDLDLTTTTPYGRAIRWTLDPATVIPPWAKAYRIVATPNQNAAYFKELHVAEVLRLEPNGDPTKPRFVDLSSSGSALWLDLTPIAGNGKGYTWSPESHDRVRIWAAPNSNVVSDFKIIGQLGAYLQVEETTMLTYTRATRVEIYSPRDGQQDSYFNYGPTYPIVRNGGVASFSTLTDLLPTDVFLTTDIGAGVAGITLQNNTYFPGAGGLYYGANSEVGVTGAGVAAGLQPYEVYNRYYDTTTDPPRVRKYGFYNGSSKHEGSNSQPPMGTGGLPGFFEVLTDIVANTGTWLNDRGRPSLVLTDGPPLPAHRPADVRWGGVLKAGSRINGLSAFDEASSVTLDQGRGRVVALKLAVQQQATGTVLIAVQSNGYSSLYLGEAPLQQGDGGQLSANTSKVVGLARGGAGDKGSVHAGSVTPWDGKLYMWSQQASTFLRYDQSGMTDLCETFKTQRLGRELAALNAFRVAGGYDPEAEIFLLTFFYNGPNGVERRTVGYSERAKGFCGDYLFSSSVYASLGEFLYSFNGGEVHQHSPLAPRNTFYGALFPATVTFVANVEPSRSKEWLSLAYHGTDAWDTPLLENEQAGGVKQRSRTLAAWAKFQLGAWVVALRKNILKPVHNQLGELENDPARLLHMGEPLQSPWLRITATITSDKAVRLDSVGVNFNLLAGQQAVPNQ